MDQEVVLPIDTPARHKTRVRPLRVVAGYVAFAVLWIFVSDWALFSLVSEPAHQALISQLKGFGFVAITGIFLYLLLRTTDVDGYTPTDATGQHIDRLARPRLVLGAFVGLLATILVTSYFVTSHLNRLFREDGLADLHAMAGLKTKEIEQWLDERWWDARVFAVDRGFGEHAHRWLDLGDIGERGYAVSRLQALHSIHGYQSLLLYDTRGKLRLELGETHGTNSRLDQLVRTAVKTRTSQFSDLYRNPQRPDHIHLDFVTPLVYEARGRSSIAGVVVLRVDPAQYLYDLIQSWPLQTRSGEMLLVRRDGDDVLFLNKLRHRPDTALTLRMPLTTPMLPAAQVLHGAIGEFEGNDYRGVPVFSVLQPIRGTPWYLVAKVDRDEVLAPIHQIQLISAMITLAAIAFAGLVVGYGWRQQMRGFALRQRLQETERLALIKHFEHLSHNANDLIILVDDNLHIVEINERVSALIGYKPAEMIGRPLGWFRTPAARETAAQDYVHFQREVHTRYETMLERRDGGEVPVEVTATRVAVDGRHYYQLVVRDITESRRHEEKLAAAAEQFQGLVEQSIAGIFIVVDARYAYVNPRLAEILGGKPADLIGHEVVETIADSDRAAFLANLARCLSREQGSQLLSYVGRRQDGSLVDMGAHINHAQHGGRPAVIGVVQDISEKKRAEEKIQDYIRQLERAMFSTIKAISVMSELRDPYTYGHEQRVGDLAAAIGTEMGLDADTVKGLQVAGYVHDIGKIVVPAEILAKPTRLTAVEFELVKSHPQQGYEVLKEIDFPWPVAQVALQHHERLDGSGYPVGLKGDQIVREARILAVADVVEAMAAHRPYRPSRGMKKALAEIIDQRGVKYDADAVDACVRLFRERGYSLQSGI